MLACRISTSGSIIGGPISGRATISEHSGPRAPPWLTPLLPFHSAYIHVHYCTYQYAAKILIFHAAVWNKDDNLWKHVIIRFHSIFSWLNLNAESFLEIVPSKTKLPNRSRQGYRFWDTTYTATKGLVYTVSTVLNEKRIFTKLTLSMSSSSQVCIVARDESRTRN